MDRGSFQLIEQGAEARLFKGQYLGRPTLMKERFQKNYRHPDLDTQLTKERTKGEARAMVRAKSAGVRTPTLFLVDFDRRCIFMEYIEAATTVKNFIDEHISAAERNTTHIVNFLGREIGKVLAKLHSKNIIHGDLTTSNMLLTNYSHEPDAGKEDNGTTVVKGDIVLIDFGLAHVESTVEDKAVDLYVLERALLSAHSQVPELFQIILSTYHNNCKAKDKADVIVKYKEVRARGRKRLMIG